MNSTTLRGIFPEPKSIPRKNFIKENIKQIKEMQGVLQQIGLTNNRPRFDKFRTQPGKVSSNITSSKKSKHQITRSSSQEIRRDHGDHNKKYLKRQTTLQPPKLDLSASIENSGKKERPSKNKDLPKEKKESFSERSEPKFTNRAMQTERTDDLTSLYETGVIKYPSPSYVAKPIKTKATKNAPMGHGDVIHNMTDDFNNLGLEERDYIRDNIKNLKEKEKRFSTEKRDPTKAPPTYQKGVLPKYLKERKGEVNEINDEPECPPGHVLLPDEERKETLRVLRQSYADRIQELNSMPLRNDTLRMRKRKMEIEEELKKIDEGIKVFQRPKVFVKINA